MELMKRKAGRPKKITEPQTVTGMSNVEPGILVQENTVEAVPNMGVVMTAFTIVKGKDGLSQMAEIVLIDGKVSQINFSVEDLKPMIMAKINDRLIKMPDQDRP
jgi:hypothetical protein